MIDSIERLLDGYSEGRLSRREAASALLGMAIAPLAATARLEAAAMRSVSPPEASFRATGFNHLGLRVTDVARSRDFYRDRLGLSVIRDNAPGNCFLRAGDHYLGLLRSSDPAVDHFCFVVEGYEADEAFAKSTAAGLNPRREEDRVYFLDLDGLEIQLDSRFGSWPGPPPDDD